MSEQIRTLRHLVEFIRRINHAVTCPRYLTTTASGALMGSGQGCKDCTCGLDSAIQFAESLKEQR